MGQGKPEQEPDNQAGHVLAGVNTGAGRYQSDKRLIQRDADEALLLGQRLRKDVAVL